MKLFASVSLLASLASAVSVDLAKRDSPLDVKLEMIGNTAIKAVVTNTGDSAIKIFKAGTFLDNSPVEKVEVFSAGAAVPFDGIRLQLTTTGLDDSAFQEIQAGEAVEVTFDAGELHDLSSGGAVDFISKGSLAYAEAGSVEIAGAIPFSSNVISSEVDGASAAATKSSFQEKLKRAVVQSDCTGTRGTATRNAMTNCRSLALAASAAAATGAAAKMTEYFKSSTTTTRNTVSAVFGRVATECGSTTSGVSTYYCSDVLGACSSGVLAYTSPSQRIMVNCPLYFSALSALSRTCHAQDQATTTLHEATHLTQIKGTQDFSAYGYNAVRALTAAQNLNHADTYTLFANAIYVGC